MADNTVYDAAVAVADGNPVAKDEPKFEDIVIEALAELLGIKADEIWEKVPISMSGREVDQHSRRSDKYTYLRLNTMIRDLHKHSTGTYYA